METTALADILMFDLYALTSKDNLPVYRVYVDDFLLTERDYRADSFKDEFVRESCPILLLKYPTQLKIEWYNQPFNYEVKNIRFKKKNVNLVDIVEQTKDLFVVKLEHNV